MLIDFSLLKEIDFTSPDNLLFLSVVFAVIIIVFAVFIIITAKIIKIIKKATVRIFNIDAKKPKFDQKETDWLHDSEDNKGGPDGYPNSPRPKIMGGDFVKNFNAGEKIENNKKDAVKSYKEKEEKSISEELNKLKTGFDGEGTVESKMPSRNENDSEDSSQVKIEIPKSKKLSNSADLSGKQIKEDKDIIKLEQEKNTRDIAQGLAKLKSNVPADSVGEDMLESKMPLGHEDTRSMDEGMRSGQLTYAKEKILQGRDNGTIDNISSGIKNIKKAPKDTSIFEGKPEVSKIKLEHEMKRDPKVWKAARQTGLNLSPVERAKLVKEVFSPALGRNISKTDLKWSIKKLNQKMLGTKDFKEHAKIRKKIKFFKKIGGIK